MIYMYITKMSNRHNKLYEILLNEINLLYFLQRQNPSFAFLQQRSTFFEMTFIKHHMMQVSEGAGLSITDFIT